MRRFGFLSLFLIFTLFACGSGSDDIASFEECIAAGFAIMESEPRQCRDDSGNVFVEEAPICIDQCGDGICQEIVCLGSGCPCAESVESCASDCTEGQ